MYSETPSQNFTAYERSAKRCKAIAQRNAMHNEMAYQKKRATTAKRDRKRKRLADPGRLIPLPNYD